MLSCFNFFRGINGEMWVFNNHAHSIHKLCFCDLYLMFHIYYTSSDCQMFSQFKQRFEMYDRVLFSFSI